MPTNPLKPDVYPHQVMLQRSTRRTHLSLKEELWNIKVLNEHLLWHWLSFIYVGISTIFLSQIILHFSSILNIIIIIVITAHDLNKHNNSLLIFTLLCFLTVSWYYCSNSFYLCSLFSFEVPLKAKDASFVGCVLPSQILNSWTKLPHLQQLKNKHGC